jgi:hypothetical protein
VGVLAEGADLLAELVDLVGPAGLVGFFAVLGEVGAFQGGGEFGLQLGEVTGWGGGGGAGVGAGRGRARRCWRRR